MPFIFEWIPKKGTVMRTSVLGLLGLNKGPRVKWSSGLKRQPITIQITRSNKLLINGEDNSPIFQGYTVEYLETKLARMKALIATSGHPINIESLAIEFHVLTGLWNNGVVTRELLERGRSQPDGSLEFELELLGETLRIRVAEMTYFDSYTFIVSGHPNKQVHVRDTPDALAIHASEPAF